ncbi:MAG: ArsR/SmtB family transcription factor [Eubacteriales bacterium]
MDLINIFKVLSDETRLRIVVLLHQQDLCVCQLTGILDVSQPKVSKNLSKLRDMDLVKDERKEKFVYYSLKKDPIILDNILKNILNNIDNYPQLITDMRHLQQKDSYLNQCCNNE